MHGRKSFSFVAFYNLLFFLKVRFKTDPFSIFLTAYENLSPIVINRTRKSRRINNRAELPRFISDYKKLIVFILWSLKDLKSKGKSRPFKAALNKSFSDAYLNIGAGTFKKREFYKRFKPEEKDEDIQFKA